MNEKQNLATNRKWNFILILSSLAFTISIISYWSWNKYTTSAQVFHNQIKYAKLPKRIAQQLPFISVTADANELLENEKQILNDPTTLNQMDVNTLSKYLYYGVVNLSQANQNQIEKNITIAEIISRKNPNIYAAYKLKLLNLLILEAKFGQRISLSSYDNLYDVLQSFDGSDDDLIHLPFIRLSALGNMQNLNDFSVDYISNYPDSYLGYFYLAESLWKMNDKISAFEALQKAIFNDSNHELILRMFTELNSNPIDRLFQIAHQTYLVPSEKTTTKY
ncbi:MAG: hypothetical protein WA160_02730 [Pseudobdellovibrio sp.]